VRLYRELPKKFINDDERDDGQDGVPGGDACGARDDERDGAPGQKRQSPPVVNSNRAIGLFSFVSFYER
jgi:hypothetical protein